MKSNGTTLLLFLTIPALVGGCMNASSNGNKAGGSDEAVVLHLANPYFNLDAEPAVDYFVHRVAELSENRLRVEVTDKWGNFAPDLEQRVVHDTGSGTVDLGWSGSRVFDTLGVRSFQALSTPMLIDSYALQNAVIDSELPAQMSRGLDQLGVTGLGVLADGLRKPVGVHHPLLGPADYHGITFWSVRSDAQRQAVVALGAAPADTVGPGTHRDEAIDRGEIQGLEINLALYHINHAWDRTPFLTANVNLWPQPAVVFSNTARWNSLNGQQHDWLRHAAQDAITQSKQLANHDTDHLAQICASGGHVVNATAADLAALRQALAPVRANLAQDPQTNTFITRIEELKRSTNAEATPATPANCAGPTAAPTSPSAAPSSLAPAGTYRWVITRHDALVHGLPPDKTSAGLKTFPITFTMTLTNGQWFMSQSDSTNIGKGTYTIDGDRLAFQWRGAVLTFIYSSNNVGDLNLRPLEPIDPGDRFIWTTEPWTKIP